MERQEKKLPLGINSFSQVISGNYAYVDKTKHLAAMLASGAKTFLLF